MLFKFSIIFASLLPFLAKTAMAECNGNDKSRSDLGDDSTIEAAFKEVCSGMATDCEIGSMIDGCVNVGKNHIDTRIDIAMKPENGTSDVTLVQEVCQKLLDQVKSSCPKKGGKIWAEASLGPEGHEYYYIHGQISAYPKKKNCKDRGHDHWD